MSDNELTAPEPLDEFCRLGDGRHRKSAGRKCNVCGCQLYIDERLGRCQDCDGVVQNSVSKRGRGGQLLGDDCSQPSPPKVYRIRSFRGDFPD